ncbi:hypothetical protein [Aquimarina sp. AU474]|uniref:PKD domain-containing protein n=1 Tax=Aquimarina sp. AU474 TaxID=2108529 RepID=UPI000D69FAFA|nr:hypothetical protein [Aquimarina sp. AU474]
MKKYFFILILIICYSCSNDEPDEIEEAFVADAGEDVTVFKMEKVILNIETDENIEKYEWELISKPDGETTSDLWLHTNINPEQYFSARTEGEYILKLTATDFEGISRSDTKKINVIPIPCSIPEGLTLSLIVDDEFNEQGNWSFFADDPYPCCDSPIGFISFENSQLTINSGYSNKVETTLSLDGLNIQNTSKLYFEIDVEELLPPICYTISSSFADCDRNTNIEIKLFGKKIAINWDHENAVDKFSWNWNKQKIKLYIDVSTGNLNACNPAEDIYFLMEVEGIDGLEGNSISFTAHQGNIDNCSGCYYDTQAIINSLKIYKVEN